MDNPASQHFDPQPIHLSPPWIVFKRAGPPPLTISGATMATPTGKAAAARRLATGNALRASPSTTYRALKDLHHFLGHQPAVQSRIKSQLDFALCRLGTTHCDQSIFLLPGGLVLDRRIRMSGPGRWSPYS